MVLEGAMSGLPKKREMKHNGLDFDVLTKDPDLNVMSILEQESLNVLKKKDSEFFYKNFTGELDPDGYLVPKGGGKGSKKPSETAGSPLMEEVAARTIKRLNEEEPK